MNQQKKKENMTKLMRKDKNQGCQFTINPSQNTELLNTEDWGGGEEKRKEKKKRNNIFFFPLLAKNSGVDLLVCLKSSSSHKKGVGKRRQ